MAGSLNKVMLIGNLGDDVKMHYFEGGGCVGRFPLATSETYMSKQTNERITNTEWHNIVVRNKGAEICEKYLSKGDKVYIEGRIKTRKWTDDKGNDRYSTEIQCVDFTFLSTKKENETNAAANSGNPLPASNPTVNQSTSSNPSIDDNDDLPF
ncbi:single-stranded DNA-binding protein [Hyunsoonleella pacifica]|uniref:Single-stranded DNA-binding protein n=1 Tax=Hyunsoonleella pacifica TaxID=1080224 RepID=A0A4Q9FR85_9FLAO|nr:single-stranded DNA-binding protein [Hyunsoonleella pacifica]TBN15779.1 single-stranded DNA-binding protein [Hyunsoonleella pacifica]GGD22583.1 single-stranded DNA-binding protein [Hyunsoonleella pacifica]